jgi:hypothetical protein
VKDQEFSFLRIRQTGKNSGGTDIFNVSGIEFYGELTESK